MKRIRLVEYDPLWPDKFEAHATTIRGAHRELVVPDRETLPEAPSDWPEQLFPGSLNVEIERYPPELDARGLAQAVNGAAGGRGVSGP